MLLMGGAPTDSKRSRHIPRGRYSCGPFTRLPVHWIDNSRCAFAWRAIRNPRMKRVHPNLNLAVWIVALAYLSSAAGCKNQQSAVAANPFFGPNRVPPPATRSLLPGQAQPYYQGDPLPVSQNGAVPAAAVAQASAAEMPSAEGNLAWSPPSGAPQNSITGPAQSIAPAASPMSSPTRSAVVASNEPSVAIPEDGNALRFALPRPGPAEPQTFTPTNPVALASTPSSNAVQQPGVQLPAPPSSQEILQAAYTEPVIAHSQAPTPSPWRSPQVPAPSVASTSVPPSNYYAPQPHAAQPSGQPLAYSAPPTLPPSYAMPTVVGANTMEVRLREVPSPPMPRIRIPGYDTSTAAPTIGSADGFRPRTSMR